MLSSSAPPTPPSVHAFVFVHSIYREEKCIWYKPPFALPTKVLGTIAVQQKPKSWVRICVASSLFILLGRREDLRGPIQWEAGWMLKPDDEVCE